ncbi:MAG: hypothetical protein OHK0029_23550 [Armatimonadaceae bacterium]
MARKVTFAHRAARVGEVLDAAAQQTGVRVYARDVDGAAGQMLTIFVRDIPFSRPDDGALVLDELPERRVELAHGIA